MVVVDGGGRWAMTTMVAMGEKDFGFWEWGWDVWGRRFLFFF